MSVNPDLCEAECGAVRRNDPFLPGLTVPFCGRPHDRPQKRKNSGKLVDIDEIWS